MQQSIQLRGGANDSTGGGLEYWLSTSLPAAISAAIVHRAASRGRCGCRGVTCAASVAVATDGAGGLGYRNIGGNDRCTGGVGWGQRRTDVMVMVMLGGDPSIHGLIVALLVMR